MLPLRIVLVLVVHRIVARWIVLVLGVHRIIAARITWRRSAERESWSIVVFITSPVGLVKGAMVTEIGEKRDATWLLVRN